MSCSLVAVSSAKLNGIRATTLYRMRWSSLRSSTRERILNSEGCGEGKRRHGNGTAVKNYAGHQSHLIALTSHPSAAPHLGTRRPLAPNLEEDLGKLVVESGRACVP